MHVVIVGVPEQPGDCAVSPTVLLKTLLPPFATAIVIDCVAGER